MSISNFVKKSLLFLWLSMMSFAAIAQASVTLTGISPKTGQANVTNINLTGNGFPSGAIAASNITVTLTPVGGGSTVTTTADSITTVSGSIRRVTFHLTNSVVSPTNYNVSISDATDGFSSTNSEPFTENPPAQITSLQPNSGTQGNSVPVTITGQYTTFIQGVTTASFNGGSGVTVSNFSVTDSTHAMATITIASGATATTDTLTVTTGNQQETAAFTVNAAVQNFSVSGTITNVGGGGLSGATLTLTPGGQATTTDANGNYSFASVASGAYTLTPSWAPPAGYNPADSAVFYPANQSINVNGNLSAVNFNSQLGLTVSGMVTYSGTGAIGNQPGQAYIRLLNPTSSTSSFGTSTNNILLNGTSTNPAAFVIHGVNPGTYNEDAYFDRAGFGARNLSVQSASGTVTVSNADVNVGTITLADPATQGDVSAAPVMTVSKIGQGVVIRYQPIMVNGVEQALAYNLAWSFTSPTDCNTGAPTNGGALSVGKGDQIWEDTGRLVILDGSNINSLFTKSSAPTKPTLSTPPKLMWFCMQGVNAVNTTSPWTTTSAITLTALPTTNGTGQSTVTVHVTSPLKPLGPVYAGCYDKTNNNFFVFTDLGRVGYPGTKTYTINGVPNGTQCTPFAGSDQDNDGLFTPADPYAGSVTATTGDIFNLGRDNAAAVAINAATSISTDLTAYVNDTNATLVTTSTAPWLDPNSAAQPQTYGLNFDVLPAVQLPVEVQLQTPSPNVNSLTDFANCLTCSTHGEFNMNLSTQSVVPNVGDSYSLLITDEATGVTDTPTLAVSGVNTAFATSLSASGGATPTFSWGNGANLPTRFLLTDASGNVIWQIPAQSGTSFSSTITSVAWPNDPTGANNPPSGTLTSGTKYIFSITTVDSNGNTATQKQVYTF